MNGDGFGVAWVGKEPAKGTCVFKFVTPAWSNANLRNLSEYVVRHSRTSWSLRGTVVLVKSPTRPPSCFLSCGSVQYSSCILAHVRAATSGHNPREAMVVNTENCHPFKYVSRTAQALGCSPHTHVVLLVTVLAVCPVCFVSPWRGRFKRWTFAHNGGIPDFKRMQRKLLNELSEEAFQNISGCTDSEHIFALFLSLLPTTDDAVSIDVLIDTVDRTVQRLLDLCVEVGGD